MQANKPLPEGLTLDTIFSKFSTDTKARKFLETWLWPTGPTCPRCNSNSPVRVYKMHGDSIRPGLYNCRECARAFTVTVGTIFEDSHIPLRKWLVAWFLLCSSKKGISSLQLQRMLDLGSYRTALFMTHRIRHALKETSFVPLNGTVEVDETFVGGRVVGKGKGYRGNKANVVSLVQRDGTKRSMVVERVNANTLEVAIHEHTTKDAHVMTDDANIYLQVHKTRRHDSVHHRSKDYARKESGYIAHTNTVESSFSLLKRGVYGTFHSVSKKHLPLYLAEFDHRWNNPQGHRRRAHRGWDRKGEGQATHVSGVKIQVSPGGLRRPKLTPSSIRTRIARKLDTIQRRRI